MSSSIQTKQSFQTNPSFQMHPSFRFSCSEWVHPSKRTVHPDDRRLLWGGWRTTGTQIWTPEKEQNWVVPTNAIGKVFFGTPPYSETLTSQHPHALDHTGRNVAKRNSGNTMQQGTKTKAVDWKGSTRRRRIRKIDQTIRPGTKKPNGKAISIVEITNTLQCCLLRKRIRKIDNARWM